MGGQRMKIIFMGTPDFAVPSLEILSQNYDVLAVITQPDKPKGRGKKVAFSPVKEKALQLGIEVFQPARVRETEFIEKLKTYHADCIAVTAFGQILPEEILNMPKYGCINVHGSLLPKYRGAAPLQWSVINGEKQTGVTTMYMAKGMDTGDMLLKQSIDILPNDTYGSIHDKLSVIGAELLLKTIEGLQKGTLQRIPQNEQEASYAPMITKQTGHIDWSKKCDEIICLIHGLDPTPTAYTMYHDDMIKIWQAEKIEQPSGKIGEVTAVNKKGFVVTAADGSIVITEVQAKGKKRMSADTYLRGHSIEIGTILA